MGEQPNPWDLLQPQDATSRHRGAKPCRRCDALQSPAAQTIPLSLSRQWRVMEAVDLAGLRPGPPSLAVREVVTGEACKAYPGSCSCSDSEPHLDPELSMRKRERLHNKQPSLGITRRS